MKSLWRCNLPLLFLVFVILTPFPALAVEDTPNGDRFLRAVPVNGKIEILAHKIIDWRRIAPAKYRDVDIKHPSQSFLRTLKEKRSEATGDASYLDFSSLIPEDIKKSKFYLISAAGITLMRLESLHGEVRYDLDASGQSITFGPEFSGYIVATAEGSKSPQGGFVLRLEKPASFAIAPVEIKFRDYPSLVDRSREQILRGLKEGFMKCRIVKSFGFRINETEEVLAFVEWDFGDDEPCAFNASILTLGKSPHELIWTASGCDI